MSIVISGSTYIYQPPATSDIPAGAGVGGSRSCWGCGCRNNNLDKDVKGKLLHQAENSACVLRPLGFELRARSLSFEFPYSL